MAYPQAQRCLLGPLELVTAATALPVDLAAAKLHLRKDTGDEDALVEQWLRAATRYVETQTPGRRQMMSATYDLPVSGWWGGPLRLPRPPLQSVTSVKYLDTDGAEQTWSSANYRVRTPQEQPGTVEILGTVSPPATYAWQDYPITVRFVAGWAAARDVPGTLKQAILLLAGHWDLNREAVGTAGGEVALAVQSLLEAEGWWGYG